MDNKYISPLPRPTSNDFFLEGDEIRKLAVGMPARPAFMDSVVCSPNEYTYLSSLWDVYTKGRAKWSRPDGGLWTLMYDEGQYVYDLTDFKLPLLSTKKIFTRSWIHETIWFLSGSTDVEYLKANNVSIWDSWVIPETARYDDEGKLVGGSIGNGAYGANWRAWNDTRFMPSDKFDVTQHGKLINRGFTSEDTGDSGVVYKRVIDQMADAVKMLKESPDGRRIIVSAWNPALLDETVLPACHSFMQFISTASGRADGKRELTLKLYQRSGDCPVGCPFNVSQYAMLAHLVAYLTNHVAVKFVHTPSDMHIYENQMALLPEQFSREPLPCDPRLVISERVTSIDDLKFEDFNIVGYGEGTHHPAIKYPVAV